ncbi:MAG TPA: 1,4-alpha-glucan branching protein GlgB [Phycisphaerae bacterium]|nr:1,4-alpha-glucan branching protein GlgB [Phycisphaerae bacterium]
MASSTIDSIAAVKDKTGAALGVLTPEDLHYFNEGSHYRLYQRLGAHFLKHDNTVGTYFAVWAPNAERVSLMGTFNDWNKYSHYLHPVGESGIWEGFWPEPRRGDLYKYHVESRYHGYRVDKPDPFGLYFEQAPRGASIVWDLDYQWHDSEWMDTRADRQSLDAPISIYEVHLGSWMRSPDAPDAFLNYRQIAERLVEYVQRMGFTHVEFLPVMEHPFYGSWGYQTTHYFAPTSRYGTPQDFMYLIDLLHQAGIGVILDWVPSHFAKDEHGLAFFDGTHLYEHADPRQGTHPDWDSYIFNYGRREVLSFLVSNAVFWLDCYHADGLRVDAVASMLYLDYSRPEGTWVPNEHGGRENLAAINFLRVMNRETYNSFPGIQNFAEESTAYPMVSRPVHVGGLGFGFKWDMGWMHDTLHYMSLDPVHRKYHHRDITFRMMYAFTENFTLPLSHDEVVHGKGSLIAKMPGDYWQRFASMRLLFAYMFTQPGKKLLFMGGEFGQFQEWNHDVSLDWHLLDFDPHARLQRWVARLNDCYRREPALHVFDTEQEGFAWIDCNDMLNSVVTFMRKGHDARDTILAAFNFTPVPRYDYRVGAPAGGEWREILNSDALEYGGSGVGNLGAVQATTEECHGLPYTLSLTLPPLAAVFFKRETSADCRRFSKRVASLCFRAVFPRQSNHG